MSKVYIVTSGEYSDYHIEAVFDDKLLAEENARRVAAVHYRDADIGEWELNESIPEIGIQVYMTKEGNVIDSRKTFNEHGFDGFVQLYNNMYNDRHPQQLAWTVVTDDLERAVKVVNEKRAIILAHNAWGDKEATKALFE